MVEMWNRHMASVFVPGWILCFDESMSIWHSMFTCPGWVFVHGSHIHLAMTTTLFAVQKVEYSHKLNLSKGRTAQKNYQTHNTMLAS